MLWEWDLAHRTTLHSGSGNGETNGPPPIAAISGKVVLSKVGPLPEILEGLCLYYSAVRFALPAACSLPVQAPDCCRKPWHARLYHDSAKDRLTPRTPCLQQSTRQIADSFIWWPLRRKAFSLIYHYGGFRSKWRMVSLLLLLLFFDGGGGGAFSFVCVCVFVCVFLFRSTPPQPRFSCVTATCNTMLNVNRMWKLIQLRKH